MMIFGIATVRTSHWVTGRRHDAWSPVFERVSRHVFLPRLRSLTKGTLLDEGDSQQRDDWMECAHTGMLVCLSDDHAPMTLCRLNIGDLANLLEHAGITEGHRVLVVGAGQGYLPALLCERLGDSHVTVTDPDAGSLDDVVARLRAAGYQPTAASDLAEDGHPANAPYDCIITNRTRDTLEISPAWIAQVKPGGKVLAVLSST
jgi:protein-L-isoaspartate O-methyltransferase